MRRAPAKPVRACILRNWCLVSHVTFEAPLRTSRFTLHTSHFTLHTSHCTFHTSHSALHSSQFTLHTSQKTQGLVLRLPPQHIAHATFMQPLQCVSQHPVANPHLSTHVATSNDDNEAAIPMQSATRDSRTA